VLVKGVKVFLFQNHLPRRTPGIANVPALRDSRLQSTSNTGRFVLHSTGTLARLASEPGAVSPTNLAHSPHDLNYATLFQLL
jgi:hypothetical protein